MTAPPRLVELAPHRPLPLAPGPLLAVANRERHLGVVQKWSRDVKYSLLQRPVGMVQGSGALSKALATIEQRAFEPSSTDSV